MIQTVEEIVSPNKMNAIISVTRWCSIKVAQIVETAVLTYNDPFRNSPKSHQSFWANFVSKFVAKNFQKSPNLVTSNASLNFRSSSASSASWTCSGASSSSSFSSARLQSGKWSQNGFRNSPRWSIPPNGASCRRHPRQRWLARRRRCWRRRLTSAPAKWGSGEERRRRRWSWPSSSKGTKSWRKPIANPASGYPNRLRRKPKGTLIGARRR